MLGFFSIALVLLAFQMGGTDESRDENGRATGTIGARAVGETGKATVTGHSGILADSELLHHYCIINSVHPDTGSSGFDSQSGCVRSDSRPYSVQQWEGTASGYDGAIGSIPEPADSSEGNIPQGSNDAVPRRDLSPIPDERGRVSNDGGTKPEVQLPSGTDLPRLEREHDHQTVDGTSFGLFKATRYGESYEGSPLGCPGVTLPAGRGDRLYHSSDTAILAAGPSWYKQWPCGTTLWVCRGEPLLWYLQAIRGPNGGVANVQPTVVPSSTDELLLVPCIPVVRMDSCPGCEGNWIDISEAGLGFLCWGYDIWNKKGGLGAGCGTLHGLTIFPR